MSYILLSFDIGWPAGNYYKLVMVRKRRQMLLLLLVAVITTLYTCVRFYHTNFLGRMHVPDHPKICQESSDEFSDSRIPLLFQDRNSDDSKLIICSETVDNPFKNSKGWQKFISALEHYKHFHKKLLEILKRNSSAAGSIRTLTFICHEIYCSGLGDQFLRLQFFFLLEVMSDRVFTIEWDEGLTRRKPHISSPIRSTGSSPQKVHVEYYILLYIF